MRGRGPEVRSLRAHELYAGAWVVWMHSPRGGYGYVLPLVCQILRVSERSNRVKIEVRTKNGEWVERYVKVESLRLPENWKPPAPQA